MGVVLEGGGWPGSWAAERRRSLLALSGQPASGVVCRSAALVMYLGMCLISDRCDRCDGCYRCDRRNKRGICYRFGRCHRCDGVIDGLCVLGELGGLGARCARCDRCARCARCARCVLYLDRCGGDVGGLGDVGHCGAGAAAGGRQLTLSVCTLLYWYVM